MPQGHVLTEQAVDSFRFRHTSVLTIPWFVKHGSKKGHDFSTRLVVDAQVTWSFLKSHLFGEQVWNDENDEIMNDEDDNDDEWVNKPC